MQITARIKVFNHPTQCCDISMEERCRFLCAESRNCILFQETVQVEEHQMDEFYDIFFKCKECLNDIR